MRKNVAKLLDQFKQEGKVDTRDLYECLGRDLRKDVRQMKNAMTFMNNSSEEIKAAFQSVVRDNVKRKEENVVLKQECVDLRKRLSGNECRVTHCEQYSRRCNLEIKGVPEWPNESVGNIIKQIATLLGEDIKGNDIQVCHRMSVLGNPESTNIVLRFVYVTKHNVVLEKAKKKKAKLH